MKEAPKDSADIKDDETAIARMYQVKFPSRDEAYSQVFAERIVQVYPFVKSNYVDVRHCAREMLELLVKRPKAAISAYNLRLIAGQNPKFSSRIKAKL